MSNTPDARFRALRKPWQKHREKLRINSRTTKETHAWETAAHLTHSTHQELIFGSSGLKIRAWPCLALGMASTMGRSFAGAVGGRVRMR